MTRYLTGDTIRYSEYEFISDLVYSYKVTSFGSQYFYGFQHGSFFWENMRAENRQGQGLTYVMPEQGVPSCRHDFEGRNASRIAMEVRQTSPVPVAGGEDVERKLREYKLLLWNAHVSPIDIHNRVNALRASLMGTPTKASQPVRIGE